MKSIKNNNKILNRIEDIMILLIIIVCSYQKVFALNFNFLDELLIVIFVLFELVMHRFEQIRYAKKSLLYFVIFLFLSLFTIVIRNYSFYAYFSDLLNYLKLIIVLSFASFMSIDDNKKQKYMKYFIIVILISIFYGIYRNFHYTYIPGDKFRNGKWRMSGLSGHPVHMGFASLICLVFSAEIEKKEKLRKLFYYASSLLSIYAIMLTQDRLPLFLAILYFSYKLTIAINKKVKVANRRSATPLAVVILLSLFSFVSIIGYNDLRSYLKYDIEGTVRFYALQKTTEVFKRYPVFGTGLGSFDCNAAVKNNSFVYSEFGFNQYTNYFSDSNNSNNAFESFLAKVVIESGLVGILLHFVFFYRMYKIAITNKNYLLIYFLICTNIYIIFNKAYQIPFVIAVSILISNNYSKYMKKLRNDNSC